MLGEGEPLDPYQDGAPCMFAYKQPGDHHPTAYPLWQRGKREHSGDLSDAQRYAKGVGGIAFLTREQIIRGLPLLGYEKRRCRPLTPGEQEIVLTGS